MNKTDHLADFVEWDVRNWSTALDFWRTHARQLPTNGLALELGSRNGGLSLWLALQGIRVVCSDIVQPGTAAVQQHRTRGVAHLIRYESINAANIPYVNEFDVIVFKSMLGALDVESQAKAISEMHKALKKGGELFFAENLTGSPLHQFLRRKFVPWGNTWQYVSVASVEKFLSQFSRVDYQTIGFAGAFGRGERQRNLLGMLDQKILNRIIPESWKYVIVGVATK